MFHPGQRVRVVALKAFGVVTHDSLGLNSSSIVQTKNGRGRFGNTHLIDAEPAYKAFEAEYFPISNKRRYIGRISAGQSEGSKEQVADYLRKNGGDILHVSEETYRCLQQLWALSPRQPRWRPLPINFKHENIGFRVHKTPAGLAARYSGGVFNAFGRLTFTKRPDPEMLLSHRDGWFLDLVRDHQKEINDILKTTTQEVRVVNTVSFPGCPDLKSAAQAIIDSHKPKTTDQIDEVAARADRSAIRIARKNSIADCLKHHIKGLSDKRFHRLASHLYDIAHGRTKR